MQKLRFVIARACSIPIFILLGLASDAHSESIQWNEIDSMPSSNGINQIQWRVLPQAPSLPPIDKKATDWVENDVPYESELRSNQIVWEELPEEERHITDEEIGKPSAPIPFKPVVVPPFPLQALDRSISFGDGFVGPDISWNVPNGLRWSEHWPGSVSMYGQSRDARNGSLHQSNGRDDDYIVHTNIVQAGNWSVGINTSVRSVKSIKTGADNTSLVEEVISNGFRIATSLGDTAGIAFGGERVIQWNAKTNTVQKFYLITTKAWWLGNEGNDYPLLVADGGALIDNNPYLIPAGSVSILFNDYVSSFIEYHSGTTQLAWSVSMNDGFPLRLTWGVTHNHQNKLTKANELGVFLSASIGF